MLLKPPFGISARLLPGLEIGGALVQLEHLSHIGHRHGWKWFIDLDGKEYSGSDLSGSVGTQGAFGDLLSFLGAFAETRKYIAAGRGESECGDLFPIELADWAIANADEIDSLRWELEEGSDTFIEE